MSDYEKTYERIRDLKRQNESYRRSLSQEGLQLMMRFAKAGWRDETVSDIGQVNMRDRNGDVHRWKLTDMRDVDDCLRALEAAEKAAKKEVTS